MVRRLLPNAKVNKIQRHEQRWKYESKQLDFDSLMSIIEAPESELLADSEDSFSLTLGYTLVSGELIPLNISFYGKKYNLGVDARDDSSIRISVQDSDLWRSLKTISRDMYSTGLEVPEQIHIAAWEKTSGDTEVLFLQACGFSSNKDAAGWSWEIEKETYIDHAAVYYECGWPCSLRCQMLYHRNPQEFTKDFERIYADYHWGIAMTLLYSIKKDILQLSESKIASLNTHRLNKQRSISRRCGKEHLDDYKYFSKPRKFASEMNELDIIDFIETLDKNKIQQLVKLPVSHIKEVFSAIAESELPEVRYRDFDEQGIVLLSIPRMSVWRAYLYLVELSSDYLE